MKNKTKWLFAAIFLLVSTFLVAFAVASNEPKTKLVYVYQDSCHFCQAFDSKLNLVLKENPQTRIERLDVQQPRSLKKAIELGAKSTPTLFIVTDGKVMDKLEGDVPVKDLRTFVAKANQP